MNYTYPIIDTQEEVDFILEQFKRGGISIDREIVEMIIYLDGEFLKQKGVATSYE